MAIQLRHPILLVVVLTASLSGCAGMHLYDEEKDKTATAIKGAQEKINIETVFQMEEKNLDTLLNYEIAVRNDFINQVRRRRLWRFVYEDDPLHTLTPRFDSSKSYVTRRLNKLGISNHDALENAAAVYAGLDGVLMNSESLLVQSAETLHEGFIKDFGWAKPYSCNDVKEKTVEDAIDAAKPPKKLVKSFQQLYKQYKEHCEEMARNFADFNKLYQSLDTDNLLRDAYDEYLDAFSKRQALEDEVKTTRNKLPGEKEPAEQTKDFLDKIRKHLKEIAGSLNQMQEGVKSLGIEKVLSEEIVSALSLLLTSFADGKLPNLSTEQKAELAKEPSLHRAAIIVAALPGIAEDLKTVDDLMKDPRGRAGLALALGYQQEKLAYLEARIDLIEARAQISADLLRARLQEAAYLRDARKAVDQADEALARLRNKAIKAAEKKTGGVLTTDQQKKALKTAKVDFTSVAELSYKKIVALPKSKVKRLAVSTIVKFDMSISVARKRVDELYFRLRDARHRESIEADAFAARAWWNLLDGPIQQIQAYHASGIKQEEITKLTSSLVGLGLLGFVAAEAD